MNTVPPSPIYTDWRNRVCVLGTMHHKERVIAPLMREHLGLTITVPQNFNTDRFGTFTGEVARVGDQRAAARAKAIAAMEVVGSDLALASEGSFGPHPHMPYITSNLELVILVDRRNNLEIVGLHRSTAVTARGQYVQSVDEAVAVATAWGFPNQGIIIRSSERSTRHIHKEILTIDDLQNATRAMLSSWFRNTVYMQTDMRMHRCPAREASIHAATLNLIENCKRTCPHCGAPGFAATAVHTYLPCGDCRRATDVPQSLTYSCLKCPYTEPRRVVDTDFANPGECAACNP